MTGYKGRFVLSETATIKDLLLCHPDALPVLLDRRVPVSCANGTIAEAARACGLAPKVLLADLARVLVQSASGQMTDRGMGD